MQQAVGAQAVLSCGHREKRPCYQQDTHSEEQGPPVDRGHSLAEPYQLSLRLSRMIDHDLLHVLVAIPRSPRWRHGRRYRNPQRIPGNEAIGEPGEPRPGKDELRLPVRQYPSGETGRISRRTGAEWPS